MRLKKLFADRKREMLPGRYRLNYRVVPVWLVLLALSAVGAVLSVAFDEILGLVVSLAVFLILWAVLFALGRSVGALELKTALEEFGYLFEKDGEEIAEARGEDVELGVKFLLKKDGVQITYPAQGEKVFDELGEDTEFLPWEDATVGLATDNYCRRVRLALLLIDERTREIDEDGVSSVEEPFFLDMTREIAAAIRSFGLDRRMNADYYALLKDPRRGMKQILDYGYIKRKI